MSHIARHMPPNPPARTLREHVVRTVRLAGPVIVARFGILVMVSVDTIMTGHVGTATGVRAADELAFLAIAYAPQLALLLIGVGAMSGTVILVSQADGAGRRDECGSVFWVACANAVALGLLWGVLLLGGTWLLELLGQTPEVAAGGGKVLVMFAPGMAPVLVFTAATMFLEGLGLPRPGMVVMIAANLVNAGLNAIMIYGVDGLFPVMGAEGAVLATTITRWFMAVALVAYILLMLPERRVIGVLSPIVNPLWLERRFLRIGLPLGLAFGLETTAFTAIALMAGTLGVEALGGYQVTMNYVALLFMIAIGLGTATAVRVGNAVGRRDARGMAMAGWVGVGLIVIVNAALALVTWLLRDEVVAVYTSDPAVVPAAMLGITIGVALILADGFQGVLLQALRGAGDIWVTTGVAITCFWFVMVTTAWFLGLYLEWGLAGLLWGEFAGLMSTGLLLGWRFHVLARRGVDPV